MTLAKRLRKTLLINVQQFRSFELKISSRTNTLVREPLLKGKARYY